MPLCALVDEPEDVSQGTRREGKGRGNETLLILIGMCVWLLLCVRWWEESVLKRSAVFARGQEETGVYEFTFDVSSQGSGSHFFLATRFSKADIWIRHEGLGIP